MRVGLQAPVSKRFVFGAEPLLVSAQQDHSIVLATVNGSRDARYPGLLGRLLSARGRLLADCNFPRFSAGPGVLGKSFRYAVYA